MAVYTDSASKRDAIYSQAALCSGSGIMTHRSGSCQWDPFPSIATERLRGYQPLYFIAAVGSVSKLSTLFCIKTA